MKLDFISEDFLLESEAARVLYHQYAENAPIIDFHNHLNVEDLCCDRKYQDIGNLWVCRDAYKYRAMRIAGIDEYMISGDATSLQKFTAWCDLLPSLIGNPLFHWSCMEMKRVFGIDEIPSSSNSSVIWEKCNELLTRDDFSTNSILRKFGVKRLTTSDDLLFDVSRHNDASRESGFEVTPSLRADSILSFGTQSFSGWFAQLNADGSIKDLDDYMAIIKRHLERYERSGCKLADHSLDSGFTYVSVSKDIACLRFASIMRGDDLTSCELDELRSFVLWFLAGEYAKRGWIMQLHIGAERWTSSRLRSVSGSAGGYACPGNSVDVKSLCAFLDSLDSEGLLPKTILYTLNPSDNAVLAGLTGSYALEGTQKVKFGPAWWYNDHKYGIEENLSAIASYSILSQSLGMTTDSRTVLSFSRHEYFRRILCNFLGSMVAHGELPSDYSFLGEIVLDISYRNAESWIYR